MMNWEPKDQSAPVDEVQAAIHRLLEYCHSWYDGARDDVGILERHIEGLTRERNDWREDSAVSIKLVGERHAQLTAERAAHEQTKEDYGKLADKYNVLSAAYEQTKAELEACRSIDHSPHFAE